MSGSSVLKGAKSGFFAAVALIMVANGGAAYGQEQTAPDPVADEAQKASGEPREKPQGALDEVKVTAQKRVEDVQDIPLSVSAIGGETIKDQNIVSLGDAADLLPNVQITDTPSFNFVSIRGLGSGVNRGFEQTVAIIIDEVYYARPSYFSNGLLDLEAIEVLRGPQGTLYGKNSPAGAIILRTGQPEFEWGIDADALYGSDNNIRFRAAATGPLIDDRLAFRAAVGIDKRDGNLFNTTTDEDASDKDNLNARLKLKFDPDGPLEFLLNASFLTVDQGIGPLQLTKIAPRHLAAMQVFDPETSGDVTDGKKHDDFSGFTDREAYDVTAIVHWDINADASLIYVGNFAEMKDRVMVDADFSPIPFLLSESSEDYRQISQELRVVGTTGDLDYVGGLYYFHSEVDALFDVALLLNLVESALITGRLETRAAPVCNALNQVPGVPALLAPFGGCSAQSLAVNNTAVGQLGAQLAQQRIGVSAPEPTEISTTFFDQTSDSYALFGQGTWRFAPKFAATAGTRFTYEVKEVEIIHTLTNEVTGGTGAFGPNNPTGATTFPIVQPTNAPFATTEKRTEFDISPKFSLQYFPNDDLMAYLTVARGFKSGGFNASAINISKIEYDEEKSLTYELGWRSEFWGNRARLNISAFWSSYEGLQITTFNGVEFFVTNAKKSRIRGIEMDYIIAPLPFLIFSGNGAVNDARYRDFKNGPCTVDNEVDDVCDLSGKVLNNAPRFTWVQSVLAFMPLGNFAIIQTGFTASYNSKSFATIDVDPESIKPAAWTLRAQLSLRDMDRRWSASLFVDNIMGKRRPLGASDSPAFDQTFIGGASDDRVIAGEVRVTF